ncbi:MAG: TIGR02147 family protein [Bdellovibrionales bacterium]|nr:TIGR02147 family protein [Bdellovibrionales bacterium]
METEKSRVSEFGEITSSEDTAARNESFRNYLWREYAKRKARNQRYSLRSFARSINLDQSLLSKILNGKRSISDEVVRKLADTLQLEEFNDYVEGIHFKKSYSAIYSECLDEDIALLANWHPFAILEYLQLPNADQSIETVSKRLNLEQEDVVLAMHKLIHLGRIEDDGRGVFRVVRAANRCVHPRFSSRARRRLQSSYLEKAKEALEKIPLQKRENMSLTIAIDQTAVEEVKRKIEKFNEELREFLNSFETKNEVYQMTFAFFPLTGDGK